MVKYKIVNIPENPDTDTFEEVSECFIDGYTLEDRLLEQVPLKITLTEDKSDIVISDYPDFFNASKSMDYHKKIVLEQTEFSSTAKLRDDNCAIRVIDDDGAEVYSYELT